MLYIIKSHTKTGCIYKIGYAGDLKRRFQQYFAHNPSCELISNREGEILEETLLHLYLSHKYPKYKSLDEWYLGNDPQIILDFHQDMRKIKRYLWLHRDEIFKEQDFKRNLLLSKFPLNKDIYEELLGKYGKGLRFIDSINPDKIIKKNIQNIDEIYYNLFSREIDLVNITEFQDIIVADIGTKEYKKFADDFKFSTNFVKKMKLCCEFIRNNYPNEEKVILPNITKEYQNYINLLGISGIRAKGYEKYRLENEVQIADSGKNLSKEITNKFLCGRKYTLKDVKKELQLIYDSLNLTKTAKASDIEEYYEVKKIKLWDANEKKQNKGYELLELK